MTSTQSQSKRRRRTNSSPKTRNSEESDTVTVPPKRTATERKKCKSDKVVVDDPEVVAQWMSLGSSKGLASDEDIAIFLLSLYSDGRHMSHSDGRQMRHSDGRQPHSLSESRCNHCNTSMVLCCLACQVSSPHAPPTTAVLSAHTLRSSTLTTDGQLSSPRALSTTVQSAHTLPSSTLTTDCQLPSSAPGPLSEACPRSSSVTQVNTISSSVTKVNTRSASVVETSARSFMIQANTGSSPVAQASTSAICVSGKSVNQKDNRDTLTQHPNSSDVSSNPHNCEQDRLHCNRLINCHSDSDGHLGDSFNDVDGEESDECPQGAQNELSVPLAQSCHRRMRQSTGLVGETGQERESSKEFSGHTEQQESSLETETSAHRKQQEGSPLTDTELYVCPLCSLVLPPAQHRTHLRTHHSSSGLDKGPFFCSVCPKTFPKFHALYTHSRLCVRDQWCEPCGQVLVSGCQVHMHRRQHGRERARTCEHCRRSFPAMSKKDFDRHLKRHKREGLATPAQATLCPQCGKVFKRKDDLNLHLTYHRKDSPFPCPLCSKAFKNKACLRQHQLFHGEKTQQCEVCGAKFYRKAGLRRHMQKHTGKQHACQECQRLFYSSTELLVHVEAVHKGIRRFPCSVCSLKFYQEAGLRVHMRTHTGEKPFSCDRCPARFSLGEALRKHQRRHTGEKPFRCEDCGQTFSCQSSYKGHRQKQHTDSLYTCNHCPKVFVMRSSLNFHIQMCHNELSQQDVLNKMCHNELSLQEVSQ